MCLDDDKTFELAVYMEDKREMKKFGIFILMGCILLSGCGSKSNSDNQSEADAVPAVTQAAPLISVPASTDPGNAGDYDGADLVSPYSK